MSYIGSKPISASDVDTSKRKGYGDGCSTLDWPHAAWVHRMDGWRRIEITRRCHDEGTNKNNGERYCHTQVVYAMVLGLCGGISNRAKGGDEVTQQEQAEYVGQVMGMAQSQALGYIDRYPNSNHSKEELIELCCMLVRLYAIDPLNK